LKDESQNIKQIGRKQKTFDRIVTLKRKLTLIKEKKSKE
jgi:hypothetical protein